MREIKEYEDSTEKQKPKEGENTETKLNAEFDKKDSGIADGMVSMAKNEVDAIRKGFSKDELEDPVYNGKFTKAQDDLAAETQEILLQDWTPEEKTKALELAFERFQEKTWSIKGTKEAQDAQWAKENSKKDRENDKKNERWNKDFKEALLKNIQENIAQKLQTQRLTAETQGNKEQQIAQKEAKEILSDTLAFWLSGNTPEKTAKA